MPEELTEAQRRDLEASEAAKKRLAAKANGGRVKRSAAEKADIVKRIEDHLTRGTGVKLACKLVQINPAQYYAWIKPPAKPARKAKAPAAPVPSPSLVKTPNEDHFVVIQNAIKEQAKVFVREHMKEVMAKIQEWCDAL